MKALPLIKESQFSLINGGNMTAYSERVGEYIRSSVTGEAYSAYVPKPLPPIPSIEMEKIYPLLDQAK